MKKKTHLFLFLLFLASTSILAQTKKEKDIQAIKAMTGCFEVEFKYTETFHPTENYKEREPYSAKALEYAQLVDTTNDKIIIQHLLVMKQDSSPAFVIKHWRQDWEYEADKTFRYDTNNKWVYEEMDAKDSKGTWTQFVYQVDDSPRYSGTATWTHVDGQSAWYNVADSPLPRREYTKRSDYNLMKRGNRVQVKDYGWLHEQDNHKVQVTDTSKVHIAEEKGYNTYVRVAEGECIDAINWWKDNGDKWANVRAAWDDIYADRKSIQLKKKVDGKLLYKHLFFDKDLEWSKESLEKLLDSYVEK